MKNISVVLVFAIIVILVAYAIYNFCNKEPLIGMMCMLGALAVSSAGVLIENE